ncbi:MepB family protein, partial [Streptococcus gordonii]
SILIKPKDDQEYKRCRLAKKTPKKEGYFTVFWKKDQDNKNIPYTDKDLGYELAIVVIDDCHCGIFIIPKEVAISKKILSTKNCKGKMAMRFYPPWCTKLNKTAQATQKWQLDYFQKIELEE